MELPFLLLMFGLGIAICIFLNRLPHPPPPQLPAPDKSDKVIFHTDYERLILTFPSDVIQPNLYTELINALSYLHRQLVLQLRATHNSVDIGIICESEQIPSIIRAIFGATDLADVSVEPIRPQNQELVSISSCILRHEQSQINPLAEIDDFKDVDPLSNILESVMPLAVSQEMSIYICIKPVSQYKIAFLGNKLSSYYGEPIYKLLHERLYGGHPKFEAAIYLELITPPEYSMVTKSNNLASIFRNRFAAAHGGLHSSEWVTGKPDSPPIPKASDFFMLTSRELAAIWHPPSNKVSVPGIHFLKFPPTPLPQSVTHATGLALGTHRQRGENVTVRLPLQDLQLGHAILLGKTRVGKTTLGHQMARGIKQLSPNSSLIILDPNGDWVTDYAKRSVSPHRSHKTYLLELGNTAFPPSIPILRPPKGVSIDTFITTTFETMKLIFRDKWSSSRMETVLFNTVAALAYNPGSTLLDIEKLYTIPGFRRRILSRVPDEVVRDYWNQFDEMSGTEQRNRTDPIRSRLSVFIRSRAIRNITLSRPEFRGDMAYWELASKAGAGCRE